MRYLVFPFLLVMLALGCASRQPQTFDGLFNPLSEREVSAMKQRIDSLRVGMTVEQCLDTLHVDLKRTYVGDVQKTKTREEWFFELREDHRLVLLWDISSGSPRLLSAGIDDKLWP